MEYLKLGGIRKKSSELENSFLPYMIGKALGKMKKNVLIGYDTRFSSIKIENQITKAILLNGGKVVVGGVMPTSCVEYLTKIHNFDIGIEITASHNPYFYNGFKLFNKEGKLNKDDLEEIESLFLKEEENYLNEVIYDESLINDYIECLKNKISFSKDKKILIDLANGAMFDICKKVFKEYKNIHFINDIPNGTNINKGVGSLYITKLIKYINDYDFIFAFDGDGDRLIGIDKKENVIDGDLYAYFYLQSKDGKYVTSEISSKKLDKILKNKREVVNVGDYYLTKKMEEDPSIIFGEEKSGHIIFKDEEIKGDALLSLILFLNECEKKNYYSIISSYEEDYRIEKNIRYINLSNEKRKKLLILFNKINNKEPLIRFSNTEEVIRINLQGSRELVKKEYFYIEEEVTKMLGDSLLCVE